MPLRPHPSRAIFCAVLAGVMGAAGCDRAQLLAPTQSRISISTGSRVLPPNGTTDITAVVTEQAGTPVQNGTTVRFTTTLGRVDPVEAQTRNGVAVTTFHADNSSGIARIRAISGAASGGEQSANEVEITVGAAAINTVTLRANPGSVGPNGGTVDLIASVVGENGQPLQGITVSFNADQGSLSQSNVVTDAGGDARTQLTITQQAIVSATAGTKTSSNVTIALRAGPILSISCTPAAGTGNCAAVQALSGSNTATVVFTVTRAAGSSNLRTATIDFGDGATQSLGNIAGGTSTITHTYSGPSGSSSVSYGVTVLATDVNGETAVASTTVVVTPKPVITPINVTIADTCATGTATGQRCTFTATATGGGDGGTGNAAIESYEWDFGDGSDDITTSGNVIAHVYSSNGTFTVTVRVRTVDGRTALGRTQVLIKFP